MKIRSFGAAALMAIAACCSANAADLPPPPAIYKAPPPPAANWTGCYIAGGGGYGMWAQQSFTVSPAGVPTNSTTTNGGKGWFGMGQAGCDYQFTLPLFAGWSPNLVIGAFGDFDGGSLNGTNTGITGGIGNETNSSAWFGGARVGYVATPRFLTYFDAGWTQARFNGFNVSANAFPQPAPVLSVAANTYNGWFLGSGFEYSFDWLPISGLFLKTEYRYSQYGSANLPVTVIATGAPAAFALNSQKSIQMVSTELVWRFNWFGR